MTVYVGLSTRNPSCEVALTMILDPKTRRRQLTWRQCCNLKWKMASVLPCHA